ncbi:hypothetical protein UPYG_G00219370 [Umbra pygmaea]|uniref:Uncharacterized protein n=1 Tax=Umbra pygmaea TaxID=75934 RepID=A0ABD0X9B4_UMBPY
MRRCVETMGRHIPMSVCSALKTMLRRRTLASVPKGRAENKGVCVLVCVCNSPREDSEAEEDLLMLKARSESLSSVLLFWEERRDGAWRVPGKQNTKT